jgi:hypothetical protein
MTTALRAQRIQHSYGEPEETICLSLAEVLRRTVLISLI